MDQAKENRILLVFRSDSSNELEAWNHLVKALKAISTPEIQNPTEPLNGETIKKLATEWDFIFLDLSLADLATLGESKIPNLTLVKKDAFPWNNPEARKVALPALSNHSCLLLEKLPATDLIRILHLYLFPKRLSGATPLMEKGSLIVGEKVQSLDAVGSLIDKLGAYLAKIEGFELKTRLLDLRQVLSAVLTEAFQQSQKLATPYPTVDFQIGAHKGKLTVNLRFPRGNIVLSDLPSIILDGHNLFWQQAWQCSDLMVITHHTQYDELEVMLAIFRAERVLTAFRSLLIKSSDRSMKNENLLASPQNYEFHVLSDIRIKDQEDTPLMVEQDSEDIDLGSLPDAVLKKITKLTEATSFLKEKLDKRESQLKESQIKLVQINKELNQKKSEIIRHVKTNDVQQDTLKRKVVDLEQKIEHLSTAQTEKSAKKDTNNTSELQETIHKLEVSLRSIENEKNQLLEKASNEQKKVAIFEQKYSTLYKEIGNKDKEIAELKAAAIKLRKENQTNKNNSAENAGDNASNENAGGKLKDAEAREAVLKQELRKLAFKLENQEKNVKAIQTEAAEKNKLLEQKLQAAKTKELELLKRVEELSAALKKAAKAA